MKKCKILVLWSRPSGYIDACLNALVRTQDAEVLFVGQSPGSSDAPFDKTLLGNLYQSEFMESPVDYSKLSKIVNNFAPDMILIGSSWHEKSYRKICRDYKNKAHRVLCMDAQWSGSFKQNLWALYMKATRSKYYDQAFVAGNRQAQYAQKLGFSKKTTKTGLYSCDHGTFSTAKKLSNAAQIEKPSFLFVGRLIPLKGVPELLKGYEIYQSQVNNPWPLSICGTGTLETLVKNKSGVSYLGFVQPKNLPAIMANHTTLIVPSHIEPWGLVIHEAVSAGMSVICSTHCGAGDAFVREGLNGIFLSEVRPETIAKAMLEISNKTQKEIETMSIKSEKLASTNTPTIWAKTTLSIYRNSRYFNETI